MTSANFLLNLFHGKEAIAFDAGDYVFKAGDQGDAMYVVLDGQVDIMRGSTILETAGPGSIFGELALIDDEPRSATVVAKTDCRLAAVGRHQFEYMVTETPHFALAVMKILADRLRTTSARVSS
jgi:CRP-like cAMP-binding protein